MPAQRLLSTEGLPGLQLLIYDNGSLKFRRKHKVISCVTCNNISVFKPLPKFMVETIKTSGPVLYTTPKEFLAVHLDYGQFRV